MTRHCHPAGYPALMQKVFRGEAEKSSSKPLESEIMRETGRLKPFLLLIEYC